MAQVVRKQLKATTLSLELRGLDHRKRLAFPEGPSTQELLLRFWVIVIVVQVLVSI